MSNPFTIVQPGEPRPVESFGPSFAALATLVEYLEQKQEGLSSHEVALALAQAQKAAALIEDFAQRAGMLEEVEVLGAAGWLGVPNR